MALDSGLGQFLDWGTATTITVSVGKVVSASWVGDSAASHQEGIGADDDIIGGPLAFGGQASYMVANHDLTQYALRTNYTTSPATGLTDLCFAGGFQGDGRKQQSCKINTLGLSCAVGGPLTANISWLGLTEAAYSTAAMTAETDVQMQWHTGVVTVGDASMQCVGLDLQINNNLAHVWTHDSATTNQKRWPDAIHVGSQDVTLSVDVLTRPTTTAWADIIADTLSVAGSAVFTFLGGDTNTETLTITLSNLSRYTQPISIASGGGLTTYALTYEAKKDTSSISITCAA